MFQKNRIQTFATAVSAFAISACATMPSFDPEVQGYWHSEQYGWVLHVEEQSIGLFDRLNGECLQSDIFALFLDIEALPDEFALNNGELVTSLNGVKNPAIRWKKQNSFEQACPEGEVTRTDESYSAESILRDYDWYVDTFTAHYAFTELRDIDAQTLLAEGRILLEANPTPETLVDVLSQFISQTQDGHVNLFRLNTSEGELDTLANGDVTATLEGALASEGSHKGIEDIESYVTEQASIILASIRQYLDMDLRQSDSGGVLHWVPVTGQNQGYVLLEGLEAFGGEHLTLDQQSHALNEALDLMLADFADKERIIIDNRLNGGGFDRLGFQIAQRFMSTETTELNKSVYVNSEWFELDTIVIEKDEHTYTGNVVLLNSPYTASAAETFSLVIAEQPNVFVLGERSAGELSDMLFKTLPNGMIFTLSNEAYTVVGEALYEFVGVPVDEESISFDETQRLNQHDETLEKAITMIF